MSYYSLVTREQLGAAGGAATLDGAGRMPLGQLPDGAATDLELAAGIVTARQEPYVRFLTAGSTLAVADAGGAVVVGHTSTTPAVMILPTTAAVPIPVGTFVDVIASNSGDVQLTPASGVTLRGNGRVAGGYGVVRVLKLAAAEWLVLQNNSLLETAPVLRRMARVGFALPNGFSGLVPFDGANAAGTAFAPSWNADTLGNQWDSATPDRLICRRDGWYLVTFRIHLNLSSNGRMFLRVQLNGNEQQFGQGNGRDSVAENGVSTTFMVPMKAADFLTLVIFQDGVATGGGQAISNNNYASSHMDWHWVRPLL